MLQPRLAMLSVGLSLAQQRSRENNQITDDEQALSDDLQGVSNGAARPDEDESLPAVDPNAPQQDQDVMQRIREQDPLLTDLKLFDDEEGVLFGIPPHVEDQHLLHNVAPEIVPQDGGASRPDANNQEDDGPKTPVHQGSVHHHLEVPASELLGPVEDAVSLSAPFEAGYLFSFLFVAALVYASFRFRAKLGYWARDLRNRWQQRRAANLATTKGPESPFRKKAKRDPPTESSTINMFFNPSLTGAPPDFSSVVNDSMVSDIVSHLPETLRYKDWHLLYASDVHGYDLQTTYRKCAEKGPFLMVVMDTNRTIFGGFCNNSLESRGGYYGNGECFVYQSSPKFRVFPWTGQNNMFLFSNDQMIGFGGGSGFALCLDEAFDRGTSQAGCSTYMNTCLASEESFKVVTVEFWGFTNPKLASRPSQGSLKKYTPKKVFELFNL